MTITGKCHCGNIAFEFIVEPGRKTLPARACTCSFCKKHGGVWTSSSTGALHIHIDDEGCVHRYQFGTRTATFHVCTRCGVVPVVTSDIEGRTFAVVSVNAFENVVESMLDRSPATFDGEGEGERLARRARNWIPDVRVTTGGA